jgi:hypothetical protein
MSVKRDGYVEDIGYLHCMWTGVVGEGHSASRRNTNWWCEVPFLRNTSDFIRDLYPPPRLRGRPSAPQRFSRH